MWASDVHFPEEHPLAWTAFLSRVKDTQPHEIILGGDILELESCSRHGGTAKPAHLVEEIVYAREKLLELRELAPTARIVFLEGNHETRLRRITTALIPTLDGAITLPSMLGLADLGIEWHRYGEVIYRGHCGFVHGWWTPAYHAAKHLRETGKSLVYGHTHKPQSHIIGDVDGMSRGGFGMPCMRSLDAAWCDGKPLGWALGWGEITVDEKTGNFSVQTVLVIDGCAIIGGKKYSGRLGGHS